MKTQLVDYKQ